MPISVSNQAYVFLCSVLGGILIAFVYDAFRIKRKVVKTGTVFIQLEDFAYWLIVAIIMFGIVYYSNEGEIRGYIFLGTILGVVLYILLLSRIIMGTALFLLRLIYKILKTVWMIVSYPIKLLIRIIAIPARFIAKMAGKGLKSIRRAGRNRLSRVAIWRRVFRNIRKKI